MIRHKLLFLPSTVSSRCSSGGAWARTRAGSPSNLDAYLDEFVFRFNRRKSRRRGLLFCRLMRLAVEARPTTHDRIVWPRRGQASKVRGPKRKTKAAASTSP